MNSLLEWTSIMANIVTSMGVIGLIAIYVSHRQTKREFDVNVMHNCVVRYQELFPLKGRDEEHLLKYVDFTNEEFFYFQQGYIPKEVIAEWLEGIVDNLPLYATDKQEPMNYKDEVPKIIHDFNLLESYPRLRKACRINCESNVVLPKSEIITIVSSNLRLQLKRKHLIRANVIESRSRL